MVELLQWAGLGLWLFFLFLAALILFVIVVEVIGIIITGRPRF